MTEQEIRDLFLHYYPAKEENIADQVYIGDHDYIFFIDDGSRVRFDCSNRDMTYIKPIDILTTEEMDTIWTKEFARKLSKKLRTKHITQKQLAEAIGVTDRSIRNYLYKRSVPDYLTLRKMAEVFECSISELSDFSYMY